MNNNRGLPPTESVGVGYSADVLVRVDEDDPDYRIGYYLHSQGIWWVHEHTLGKVKYDTVYEWWPLPQKGTGIHAG